MLDQLKDLLERIAAKLDDLGIMGADSNESHVFTVVQPDGREVMGEWIGAAVAEALTIERTVEEQKDPQVQERDDQYKQDVGQVINNMQDFSSAVYHYGDGIDNLTKSFIHVEEEQTNIENKQLAVLESLDDTFTAMHEAQELERARAAIKYDTDIVGPNSEGSWMQKAMATMSDAMAEFRAGMDSANGGSGGFYGGMGGDGKKKRRPNRRNRGGPGGRGSPGGPGGRPAGGWKARAKSFGSKAAAATVIAVLAESVYQKVTDRSMIGDIFGSDDEEQDSDTQAENTTSEDASTSTVDASTSTVDEENNASFLDSVSNTQLAAAGVAATGAIGVDRYLQNRGTIQPVVTGPGDIVDGEGRRLPGPNSGQPPARTGALGKIAKAGGSTLRSAGYLGTALMAADVAMTAFDPNVTTEEKTDKAVVAASGAGGGWAGAAAGAAIGTMILPGIGTAVGGLLGGALGSYFGMSLAETAVNESEEYRMVDQQLLDLRKFEEVVKYRNPEGYDQFVSNNDDLEDLRDDIEDADPEDISQLMQEAERLISEQIENIERFEEPDVNEGDDGGYSQLQDPITGDTVEVPKYTPSNDQRTTLDESVRYGSARHFEAGLRGIVPNAGSTGMSNVPTVGPTASATTRGSSSSGRSAPTLDSVGSVPGGLPGLHDQYTASS